MSAIARQNQPDRYLLFITVLLCGAGLVMVTSASVAFAYTQREFAFYYAERQAIWMAIGFVALFVLSRIDYRKLRPFAPAAAVAVAILMILVLVPHLGVTVNGARRWFDAGPFGAFEPSELGKLAFAMYIAHWIDRRGAQIKDFKRGFLPFVGMLAGVLALLMMQKDLGTAIVTVAIFTSAFWAGGGRISHIVLLCAVMGLAFIAFTVFEQYRFARLVSWSNPLSDPLGAGFQSTQSIYGLASGGVFGVGIGHSVEKYGWLPEAHTDFIFAIIGEETGLVGTSLVMLGFLFFGWRGYRTALRAPDTFGLTLAVGITTWVTFEALLNMATVTSTIPVTGVPLPFFSYGGTAVASTLAAVGVLLSIARRGSNGASDKRGLRNAPIGGGGRDRWSPLSRAGRGASLPR